MKLILFLLIVISTSYSKDVCKIDNKIMYSILIKESYSRKDAGYPYIISFNNESDQSLIKKTKLNSYMLNSRNLDCKNKELCEKILKSLVKHKITNLDLGPYQIHFDSHYKNVPLTTFFDLQKSYLFACNYVKSKIDKYGFNWFAIASYHSETPKFNYIYQKELKPIYKDLKNKELARN
ncbi:lysozyme family protein [Aliarcobacter butzleri]|uniref:hypothetical protein n=1 Tax=Aliarcobacter butzleri TaxID=28197 RepID=UPI002B24A3CA|nr:hypothetical protein [Aliarcobacter butzleri]